MAIYATQADLEGYIPDLVMEADAMERYLQLAERTVDMALGRYRPVSFTTGLKLDPATLEPWRRVALSNAVCAQVEYMLIKGSAFFAEEVPLDPSGPDGSQKGREPLLAPKARQELTYAHLFRLAGRSQVPFPNQNVDDYVP